MFLSTENPPNDPLSSTSNFLHLTTSSDELGQSHLPNFSIRDYAYSNRKRNIKNNWPFSTKSLHLFATHGVTDPLPPFQRFSTLSNQFETTASSSSGRQIAPHVHELAKLKLNQTIAAETRKGVCSQSRIVENGLFTTSTNVSKSKVEIAVASTSNSKNNNHSRKSGSRGTMVKSKEDSCVGVSTTTSESTMASKTCCPICKTFSSASNTTLNAHIDQCLSADLPQPPVNHSKPNKPRVDQCLSVDLAKPQVSSSKPNKARVNKPRTKVKTMVDIYASAKGCTLEDLDRRNGTNWVSILSCTNRVVAADKSSEVSKKRKVSSPVGVGPVYIDAKGQKLRILSEFSEKKKKTSSTTTPSLRDQQEDCSSEKKCLSQGNKENSKVSRKRGRGKKQHKFLKLTNHKDNASEIPECGSGFAGEGRSTGRRRIYNQRMLSKRGLVPKKLNVKEKGHKFYALRRDQPSENDDDDSWSERDPLALKDTELNQKLRSEVAGRSNKTLFGNKRAQSRSFQVQMSEKEKDSLERVHRNTLRFKKSVASIQEDAIKVSDASPRPSSMRKLSPLYVANTWRRLPMHAELKKARLDFSEREDEEEETGKWESEMNQEREMSDDDDYVSGDKGETNEVLLRSNLSSSGYDDYSDDDDEESSEEEEDDDNNKRANALDKTDDDTGAEFYQSDTTPSIEIIPSERAMYYPEEVEDMIYGQGGCKEDVRFGSEVGGHGSLFVEVDTIPIPGPPGSFLPSPRDMGFDENLGNSSVITSQVQSSMDQLDRNSSESPVSAVSNFAAARLSFPAELSSSFRENLSLDIPTSSSYSTTPMSFCAIAEAEPNAIDKTTAPSRFRNSDHESCCCQRKERISECITLNHHQASHLLQRRAAASSSSMAMDLTKSITCMDPNHPFEQSPYMIQQDFDLQSKFSSRTSLSGAVPPSPNPVLRLMGKDLMVMNQGEGAGLEASGSRVTPAPQVLDPPTGLYFNTGLYLRNSFESTHQPQTPKAQASAPRSNFDQVRYFSPS
uniref:Hapless 8 n=1 Tax=Noccaea caerulescens TaxID=107243 RepID=A0A1J3IK31_NOCCA